jgi:transposase-like protein
VVSGVAATSPTRLGGAVCHARRRWTWDTRLATIGLAIAHVRDGAYFPSLLDPRRRAERALLAVV